MDVRAFIDVVETYVPQLLELGYEVGLPHPELPVVYIAGFGMASYQSLEELDALEQLVDPDLHQERVEALEQANAE